MADPIVRLNTRGVNQIMKSAGVQAELDRRAKLIADAAGPGFTSVSNPHRWVARAFAQTASLYGMRAEAKDRRLSRALEAGRG
jgi:hypothetical protein